MGDIERLADLARRNLAALERERRQHFWTGVAVVLALLVALWTHIDALVYFLGE